MKKFLPILLFLLYHTFAQACICGEQPFTLDSLSELEKYDFIALVKIKGETPQEDPEQGIYAHLLDIEIIEHFKGASFGKILEYNVRSSCELGIEVGEEWILFALKNKDGEPSVGACERNLQYKDVNGQRYNHYYSRGVYALQKLRNLYGHPQPDIRNGLRETFYPNGQQELMESFRKGQLHGERKIWYPNGQLMRQEHYVRGKRNGPFTSYFASGQVSTEEFFQTGLRINVSRSYYDTSLHVWPIPYPLFVEQTGLSKNNNKSIQVSYESIYDENGKPIIFRHYRRTGQIASEQLHIGNLKEKHIYYHDNGNIETLCYYKDKKSYGKYLRFFPDGRLNKAHSWEYDKAGRRIKLK